MAFILAFEEDCGHPSLSALLKREEKLRAYKGKLKQVWAAKNGVPVEAPIDAKELLQGCSIQ